MDSTKQGNAAGKKLTDFNDLHVTRGLGEVKAQIDAAIVKARGLGSESPAPSEFVSDVNDFVVPDYMDDVESPEPSGVGVGFGSHDIDGNDGRYSTESLLNHFSYIYNTDTCWDAITRDEMKLSHLRFCVGRDKYKSWDESRSRKMVMGLRFEPGQKLGDEYINLYEGFGVEPNAMGKAGCPLILDHIRLLCRSRTDAMEWLLSWMAYPLQNPGAKMASSLVVYGSEGLGKSIMFDKVLGKIYGAHATTIGQAQLESSFTDWQSKKLFALAEEVVARTERNHYKGMLKHLVTGSSLQIDKKHMPLREETNHINFVFLSNSTVPLELDQGDRRYMVLYGDDVPTVDYFNNLHQEITNQGVESFFQFLLDRDLSEFSEHTKPPMTDEKYNLISASLTSPQYFHRLWSKGELDIPYMSAKADDLFKFFNRWCEENGEFRRTNRFFGQEISRAMKQHRTSIAYPNVTDAKKTCRIYMSEHDMHSDDHVKAMGESCRKFAWELYGSDKNA
jgi:putative DNA primase/helicase